MREPAPGSEEESRFRQFYEDSELWSCCGYDGLSVAFDLPLDAIRSLTDDQKRGLVRLLGRLAKGGDESLRSGVRRLEQSSDAERLAGLVQLAAPLPGDGDGD